MYFTILNIDVYVQGSVVSSSDVDKNRFLFRVQVSPPDVDKNRFSVQGSGAFSWCG